MVAHPFFLSHPIFTPYYLLPIATLSLWTLSFAWLPSVSCPMSPSASPPLPAWDKFCAQAVS